MTTNDDTRPVLRYVLMGMAALVAVIVIWSLVEPWVLTTDRVTFSHPDIPAEFEGARIVYLADVHAGPYYSRARVARLIDRVQAEKPDLIILGGDYVGGHTNGYTKFYPEAKRLSAPLGVVAVLGNHDHWEGLARSKRLLAASGIILLDNDNVRTRRNGATIRIAGVDDAWRGSADVEAAATDISRGEFAIFVNHNPDYFPEALPLTKGAFDLALSAHTHGGQVTAFGQWAPIVPSRYGQRYREGWLTEQDVPILVTRGVGTVTVPLRFFAPPQIHVITLKQGPVGVSR